MVSLFEQFKEECVRETAYKKLSDFDIGTYPIIKFQFSKSKYGKEGRRLSVIFHNEPEKSTIVHLPDRFLNIVKTDADIMELNQKRYNLIYKGIDVQQRNKYLIGLEEATD